MSLHANAKLGLAGRFALVTAIEGGLSLRAAAVAFSVSPATAHRWWHRWLEGDRRPQSLLDRSSRPHRSPAGADLRLSSPDRLGTAACCRGDRLCPLDRLEGAAPAQPLPPRAGAQGAGQQ